MGNQLLSNAAEAVDESQGPEDFPPHLAEMPDDDEPEEMPADDDPWSDEDWDDEDDDQDEDDDGFEDDDDDEDWDGDWDDDDDGAEARRRDERSSDGQRADTRPKHHGRHGSDRRHSRGTRRVID